MTLPANRNFRIDLLRGISICLVLLLHYQLSYALTDSPLRYLLSKETIRALTLNGNYGVTMFFAISGYLITSTTIKRYGSLAQVDIKRFYIFRMARILPCLLAALAVIVMLSQLGQPAFMNLAHPGWPSVSMPLALLSVLTFWHNVLMQHAWYFNYAMNIYWSLSVEEVFYLLFPLLCFGLKREWAIATLWLAAIAVGPLYRSFRTTDEIYFMYGYAACFDAVAFGCLAALFASKVRLQGWLWRLVQIAAAGLVASVYLRGIDGHEIFGFSLIAAGIAVLLVGAGNDKVPTWLQKSRPLTALRWLGRHSYELYLFHIVMLGLMRSVVPKGAMPYAYKLPALALFLLLSVLVAGLIARFYSEPLNTWLRKALLRPQPAAASLGQRG